eukprot:5484815-Pyramimonas_sp.AAC.1
MERFRSVKAQQFPSSAMLKSQACSGTVQGHQDVTIESTRHVKVLSNVFGKLQDFPPNKRCNSVSKKEPLNEPMKRERGGRTYSNIDDKSGACIDQTPPP